VILAKEEIVIGEWGIAIFSDDLACDVRDDYKYFLGEGYDNDKAIEKLIHDYSEMLDDPEDGTIFWLALAATQWKLGRLREDIKVKALEIIENGVDLKRWEQTNDKKLIEKRKVVLEKLKEQLNTPQCPLKRVPKVFKQYTKFSIGDIVCYTLNTGIKVVFKTVWINEDYRGNRYPIFAVYKWSGTILPSLEEIANYPIAKWFDTSLFEIYMRSKKDYPEDKLEVLGNLNFETKPINGGYILFNWGELDNNLKTLFKLV